MTAPQFTSGPWQRRDDYDGALIIIGNVDGESFSDGTTSHTYDFVANCEDEYGEPASAANVRLILAAPELYAAVEALLSADIVDATNEALDQANAALAKARGDA